MKFQHTTATALMIAIGLSSIVALPALANWWALSPERSISCYIPNQQTNFNCFFGPYRKINNSRQVGGFYLNPRHQFGGGGTIPIEYRTNGNSGWIRRDLTYNSTSSNYIDFGNGINSFEFRVLRPRADSLGGGTTTTFRFNYDLDR